MGGRQSQESSNRRIVEGVEVDTVTMTYGIFTSPSVEKAAYHGLPKMEFSWENWYKFTTFVKYMQAKERHPYVVYDARQLENANIISYETIGASVFTWKVRLRIGPLLGMRGRFLTIYINRKLRILSS